MESPQHDETERSAKRNVDLPTSDRPARTTTNHVLVRVEGVSKKYCRSLKRSLWYGVCDIGSELALRAKRHGSPQNSGRASAEENVLSGAEPRAEIREALRLDEFWAVKDVSFEL